MSDIDKDIEQIKSSLKELETERDDIQLLCIKAELELSIENVLSELENLQDDLKIHEETSFDFQAENIKLREITNQYNAFKGDLPDNTKIIFADSEYFQNGIFKDKLEELETYKKIAEKLADKLEFHYDYEYVCFIKGDYGQCGEKKENIKTCKECLLDWARKEVEK